MRFFVAVTDPKWYRFLRDAQDIDEVNFWRPSAGQPFRALSPGGLFLFKAKAPDNAIVGGGFFQHYRAMSIRWAWDCFGIKNGASSLQELRRLIGSKRQRADRWGDYQIGCIMLTDPFFFTRSDWIDTPSDWSPNVQVGKSYDSSSGEGARLWEAVQLRLQGQLVADSDEPSLYGDPRLVRPRLGQGSFRVRVTETYEERCAVTEEKALPVLEAAHIKPVSEGGRHLIENGLLLRSDIHRLFDRGYVTVTPDHRFRVSRKLKDEFDNGEPYYPLAGSEIRLPEQAAERPRREFLEWHADTVFRG